MLRLIARNRRQPGRDEGGQVIVVFAISLVAIVAMTGLVIDGGDTFLQRRTLQNAADTAAMAGAYAYTMTTQLATSENWARQTAASNGFTDGTSGVTVAATVVAGASGATVTVTVGKPHRNAFSGVVGFPSWPVSATATAVAAPPNGSYGLMPVIFNQSTFSKYGFGPGSERAFDEPPSGNQDIPKGPEDFNWTIYCTAGGNSCNADSSGVRALIDGHGEPLKVELNDNINPLNAGSHTTLFDGLSQWLGDEFPVAIVNDAGKLQGWAIFHLTGSVGGSTKQIRGYFTVGNDPNFQIDPNVTGGTSQYGAYLVKLTN
jgi:Flp pilus assembly protein TadG